MSTWNETSLFAILIGVALKSTAVLGAAWLAALAMRGRSAAARHLIWTAAAAAILALPVLSVALPDFPVPVSQTLEYGMGVRFQASAVTDSSASTAPAVGRMTAAVKPPARPFQSHWRTVVLLLWAAGSLLAFVQMLIAFARAQRARRAAAPSPYHAEAAELAEELGIRHPVDVLESASGAMPMTFGILRPVVFLPRDAAKWSNERRRVVLLHELAHISRGDVAAQLVARLALILHWWNPLAWTAWRESLSERERATDDLVLRAGARASDYAGHLLEIARLMQSGPTLGAAGVAMARRSQLEGRMLAILDTRINRKPAGRVSIFAVVLAALVLIAPVAAVRGQQSSAPTVPEAGVDATIRAAVASKNSEMLEKPAGAFADLHQYDVARKLLDSAVAIQEQTSGAQSEAYGLGLLKIADLERKRNRASEAESFYAKAVGVLGNRPETAPALLYLGVFALGHQDPVAATGDLQRAETLDPALAGQARMWIGLAAERSHNPEEAETMYRSALAAQAADSAAAANTNDLLARFLVGQGRLKEAQPLSDRAKSIRDVLSQASSPKPDANVFHVGDGVTPPKIISKVDPPYPLEGKTAAYSASVLLGIDVGTDGAPHNIHVVRSAGFGLDESAAAAVSQWRFEPGTKDGAPVPVYATIEVNFTLR